MNDIDTRARQAADSTAQRCVLVSCDSHVGPAVREQLRGYCPSSHLDVFDAYCDDLDRASDVVIELNHEDFPQLITDATEERSRVAGLQDPAARLRDMDCDGVSADVLYHGGLNGQPVPFSTTGLASWHSDAYLSLEAVGVRIYNRWLADFVSTAPERHVGVAHISALDIPSAVEEVVWAKSVGLDAVNLPAPRRDLIPYTEPAWDRFWATCADLEMTLTTHGGGGDIDNRFTGQAQTAIYLIEMPWMGRRAVWHLIMSGVFERHPGLCYTLAEQHGDWVPALLKEMDSAYLWKHGSARLRQLLPNKPSEYFLSNCFVVASFMSHEEAVFGIENGIADRFLWGADYPHPEGSFPFSELSLRKTMAGLGREHVDGYLNANAARAYRMDADHLQLVADRIGPTYEALAEPYDSGAVPDEIPASMAFRDYGHYA